MSVNERLPMFLPDPARRTYVYAGKARDSSTLLGGAYILQPVALLFPLLSALSSSATCCSSMPQKQHGLTVVWLHGLGKDAHQERSMFEMVANGVMRFVAPNPPKIPITSMKEEETRAWFDLYQVKITNDKDVEEDDVGKCAAHTPLHITPHQMRGTNNPDQHTPLTSAHRAERNDRAATPAPGAQACHLRLLPTPSLRTPSPFPFFLRP
jgi:hypothetical protein